MSNSFAQVLPPALPAAAIAGSADENQAQLPTTDAFLVEEVRRGNSTAFEQLMSRHYRWCFFKAYSILGNHGDAEDETQNTFAKAFKNLWQFHGEGAFAGWLNRIVVNQCMMRIRERQSARMVSVDQVFEWDGSFRMEVVDQRSLPEEHVGDEQVSSMLWREIRGIPPLLREPLIMRELQRLSMSEVASKLGISVPAAKSRLMRARQELKTRLTRHGGERGFATLLSRTNKLKTAHVRATV